MSAAIQASPVMGNQASAVYHSARARLFGSYLDVTGGLNGSRHAAGEDGLAVSETARKLLERARSVDVFSIIFPDSDVRRPNKSLEEVESDFNADFSDFSSAFAQLSGLMGISGAESYVMGLDGVGGMTVSGDSEATAAKLRNGFNQNSTMVSRFAVMAARAALVDAGHTVPGFKDAYASDAVDAIGDNIDALKERLLGFRTVSGGGTMRYGFMRDFALELSATETAYGSDA